MLSYEELNKKKKQIVYQINAIKPYMTVDGHDEYLESEWNKLQLELQELQNQLQELDNQLAPLTKRKEQVQYVINSIAKYMTVDGHDDFLKNEWDNLRNELNDIENKIKNLKLTS